MAELAVITKRLDFQLEQVQDFTPTPMTISTETWYTGYDPYTLEPVSSAKTQREKLAQRQFFFWYKPEERRNIEQELKRIGRPDLISKLYAGQGMSRPFGDSREYHRENKTYSHPRRDSKSNSPSQREDKSNSHSQRDSKSNHDHYREKQDRQEKPGNVRGRNRRH